MGSSFPYTKVLTIETLLLDDEGRLRPYHLCRSVADSNYVEGAARVEAEGIRILDIDAWDLIDQLWCYFVNGVVCVMKGRSFDSGFPDQPIKFRFEPVGRAHVRLSFDYEHGGSTLVKRVAFVNAFKTEGGAFLQHMIDINPRLAEMYRYHRSLLLQSADEIVQDSPSQ